jgi:hypothetical protein
MRMVPDPSHQRTDSAHVSWTGWSAHYGLGIIPWSPLQWVIKKESTGVRRLEGRAAQSLAEHWDEIQAYEDLAAEVGAEPGTLGAHQGSPGSSGLRAGDVPAGEVATPGVEDLARGGLALTTWGRCH